MNSKLVIADSISCFYSHTFRLQTVTDHFWSNVNASSKTGCDVGQGVSTLEQCLAQDGARAKDETISRKSSVCQKIYYLSTLKLPFGYVNKLGMKHCYLNICIALLTKRWYSTVHEPHVDTPVHVLLMRPC